MSAEPTLRLLLEDLNSDPDKYKNALVVNLHGELLPMPALRNFSDAAKDPVNHPGWRVVTHPEELRTRKDDGGVTDPLRFRVYAYADVDYSGPDRMDEPMIVDVMGVDLIDHTDADGDRLIPLAELEFLEGGVPVAGDDTYSDWQDATHLDDVSVPSEEMYYLAQFVSGSNPHTRIYLYNTPLECPLVDGKGLADTERAQLYRMEYIPSPVSTSGGAPEFTDRYADALERLRPMADDGLLEISDDGLRVLDAGKLLIRNLAMAFDAYLPDQQREGGGPKFSRTV